ncbi:MAG: DEAD/DEAH box helicase [Elusimicrobia bacterium]|nr:DEAD/DEAH box helicase [Elusimicrobiota bacterium]
MVFAPNDHVRVPSRPDLGIGEVLRVSEVAGLYQADVAFNTPGGRQLEVFSVEDMEIASTVWDRLQAGHFDPPEDYRIKQLAIDLAHSNSGGELSSSRVELLPHQILLVHDLISSRERRVLVADEVGLGKTVETGMLFRELIARGEARRVLIICPAGLTRLWRQEMADLFKLHFTILGEDFSDYGPASWESQNRAIASIDAVKRPERLQRLLAAAPWDIIVIDEAHHLTRTRSGGKVNVTKNYRLADALRNHTRDFLLLSATPHQGNVYQFWSLIQLLNDQLFPQAEDVARSRGLLPRVMIRRTKRQVTDAAGQPIFRRRQVAMEPFNLAPRERDFYEQSSDYLREGYRAAGILDARTSSRQRAIGFVMVTFQKIMSSSPRAILQALRRRLLVLLARQQMTLETRRRRGESVGEQFLALHDEMLRTAQNILGLGAGAADRAIPRGSAASDIRLGAAEAEAYVARVRQQLLRRRQEVEETPASLDPEDEEDALYGAVDIPNEAKHVRDLILHVPPEPDRRFQTLLKALRELLRSNPQEHVVIFTQYRDTLAFLADQLGSIYGAARVAKLLGGPIEDKIAAIESFQRPDGAQFLISTSAGAEGINLQNARIMFNYDLPWNPMAVEQRIGRLHRYGQQETVQVYNLQALETVEIKIYDILEAKLLEIARSFNQTDENGQPQEDFRAEILGYLGSKPDYRELYKQALLNKDYARTEEEIQRMIQEALLAKSALDELTQDLSGFNLQHYKDLEGHYSLGELGEWVRATVLRLGGGAMPVAGSEGLWSLYTPDLLQREYRLLPKFERVTFDRDLALRTRNCELGGIGHPLIDALLEHVRRPNCVGDVASLGSRGHVCARYLVQRKDESGRTDSLFWTFCCNPASGDVQLLKRLEFPQQDGQPASSPDTVIARRAIEDALKDQVGRRFPSKEYRSGITISLIGLHIL